MDILHPKLYRISTYEYYCPSCSTHYEIDDLTLFKPHHEARTTLTRGYLNTVKDKDEWSRFTVLEVLKTEGSVMTGRMRTL